MGIHRSNEKKLIVFLDSGDTLIDEGTQVFDEEGIVLDADLIPGADVMVKTLFERGYTLALVADGNAQSFKNVLTQNGLYDYFTTMVYSETIKALKPSSRMFKAAIGGLDLDVKDCNRIVMVGNNLRRDIKGANLMGIKSVFLKWSPRYPQDSSDKDEQPDYTIFKPVEFIDLAEKLNKDLS